jgi:uncharacterized Fe-S cluster-containing protein
VSESAIRGRTTRAKAAAFKILRSQGLHVWDISHGHNHAALLAYEPDGPTCREILICLDSTSIKSLGKLPRRRGVKLELWHRARGEKEFSTTIL